MACLLLVCHKHPFLCLQQVGPLLLIVVLPPSAARPVSKASQATAEAELQDILQTATALMAEEETGGGAAGGPSGRRVSGAATGAATATPAASPGLQPQQQSGAAGERERAAGMATNGATPTGQGRAAS